MTYKLKPFRPTETLYLPSEICRFLPAAQPSDVKLLLYLYNSALKNPAIESFSEDIIEECSFPESFSEAEIAHAFGFWRAVGIFTDTTALPQQDNSHTSSSRENQSAKRSGNAETESDKEGKNGKIRFDPSKKPSYTSAQLAEATEIPAFQALLEYTEKKLNKMLNPSELAILFSFFDSLALPTEVIMLATESCVSEGKRSLRYIEKLLIDFADKDIRTYEAAEAYINSRKKFKTTESRVRTMCGMGERSLTKDEKKIIGDWASNPAFSFEMLSEAYDLTIKAINKPTLAYINKILMRWSEEGIDTPEKIRCDTAPSTKVISDTYDIDDFFKVAVEKERKK